MGKNKRTRYSEEFKKGAIKLVLENKQSIAEVCRNLGVSRNAMERWLAAEAGSNDDEKVQIRKLEAENKQLHKDKEDLEDLCGYDDYKRACHDSCTHTPLIIHGPGFSGGKTIEAMTSLIDLPATILECAGINKPESIEGNNLKRLIDICPKDWPDDIFMQISESQVGRAIRIKEWKYSVKAPGLDGNFYSCSETYTEDFLYDLKNDPYERNNLVACPDFVEKRNELSKLLIKRMTVIGEKVSVILPKIH
jgi:AraC-like DNA-binding protein